MIFIRHNTWSAVLLSALLLSGCSTTAKNTNTLASVLEQSTPLITPQPLPKPDWTEAEDYYQRLGESASPAIKSLALQRLADIALEQGEQQLGLQDNPRYQTDNPGYLEAITQYNQLLEAFPDQPQNDIVLYQLARAYDYAAELEKVLDTLSRLVNEYPESSLYAESQFRRGEILFSFNEYDQAVAAYQAVIQRGEGKHFYRLAIYKKAWSLYRGNQLDEARITFSELLDHLELGNDLASVGIGDRELVEDTLRILAIGFSNEEGERSIQQFYQPKIQVASTTAGAVPYLPLIYSRLAEIYLTQKRYSDTANVYGFFAKEYAMDDKAPEFALQAIDYFEKDQRPEEALQARINFANDFAVNSHYWQQRPEQLATITPQLQENIKYLANYYHARYQQTPLQNQLDATQAEFWYQHYLSSFTTDPNAAAVHFLLAELLFELARYAEAAVEYETAAYNYPLHEKSAEAAYAALLAHEKRTDLEEEVKQQTLLVSSTLYLNAHPDHQHAHLVRHQQIDQYIATNNYAAAANSAQAFLDQNLESQQERGEIWSKLALSKFMLEDYAGAEQASREALLLTDKTSPAYQILQERLAGSIYRLGEQAQAMNNLEQAAIQFLRVADVAAASAIAIQANYDGATALIQLEQWDQATQVLEQFVFQNSGHDLQQGAREKLAFVYDKKGDQPRAAKTYQALADYEQDPEKKRLWLSAAAENYQHSNNAKSAVIMLKSYLTLSNPGTVEYVEVENRIAQLQLKLGKKAAYYDLLAKIKAYGSHPKMKQQPRIYQLAAESSLVLAQREHEKFSAIKLKNPLKESLGSKQKLMKQALAAYKDAVELKVSHITTASTYNIAQIYHELSQALMDSPRPKGLDADEQEMYELMLEEQAFPFEEQAIDIYQNNSNRVTQNIYDEWVKLSFERLAELSPARYAKREVELKMFTTLN